MTSYDRSHLITLFVGVFVGLVISMILVVVFEEARMETARKQATLDYARRLIVECRP